MNLSLRETIEGDIKINTESGEQKAVAFCSANINTDLYGFSFMFQVRDKDLLINNHDEIKRQFEIFMSKLAEQTNKNNYNLF